MEITETIIKNLIGYKPKNIQFYQTAFMHKSIAKELESNSYERLEFVGDSVIGIIMAKYLYEKYPNENEGFLTKIRTKIVSSKGLSSLGQQLELHKYIQMNTKALNNEWNKNQRIIEDVFEALFGAMFLDLGLDKCSKFMIKLIEKHTTEDELQTDTNYKDILMKFLQSKKMGYPEYCITNTNGPDHSKHFTVQIIVNKRKISEGSDKAKKQAEQNAAYLALKCLGSNV